MLKIYTLFCFLTVGAVQAQPARMELTPNGFDPVEVSIPNTTPTDKLVEVTKAWAAEYNRFGKKSQRGFDATEVTDNTITILAYKKDAFFFRDRGEAFEHKIRYTLQFTFSPGNYTVAFNVVDIYGRSDTLLEYKLPDYFTSEGKLKEGYTELDTSLENTVNDIVNSHYNFLINFR